MDAIECYTRDGSGNVTAIAFATVTSPYTQSGVTKTFDYNGQGQRIESVDEEGKVTEYEYYASGDNKYGLLKTVIVDPGGLNLETEYLYSGSQQLASVTDPLSNGTVYVFDALGRKTKVTTPTGIETEWHYDGNGNVTSMDVENLDQAGSRVSGNEWLTTSYTYGTHNQLLTITEEIDGPTTRTTTIEYEANLNRIRVTKPESNKEKWTYNSRNLVATHVRGETSGVESTTTYAYDDNGNLVTLTDARSNATTWTYDLFDRRTRETNALGHYEQTTYDKASNVIGVARYDSTPHPDVVLQRSLRYFDQRNRLWKTEDLHKDPSTTYSDAVTTIERFKTGHVRYVTDPRSKVSETQYDNAWRVTKSIDAMGNETANVYDAAGRRTEWSIKEIDGGGSVTHEYEADYDDDGRMTERREIDRTNGSNVYTTTYAHDSRSHLLFSVNAEGNPTRYTYDGVGRMTKKEVALGFSSPITTFTSAIVTEWAFDKNNRLISFKDDAANTSTWTYDAKDRVSTMVYPNTSQVVTYTYDEVDNVVELEDPSGNLIEDTFDVLNRNTLREVTLQSGWLDTTEETRTYDALNRLLTNEDDDYLVTYTYGVLGMSSTVYEETQEYATGTAYAKTVTTKYDAARNRVSETYPSALALTYAYNDINALASVTDGTNSIAAFSYVGFRPKVTTFGNGATATYTWGGFRPQLTGIHHQDSGSGTLVRMDYGYNQVHDRTYERYGGSGSAGDAFEYDKAQRLTKAWMGSDTPASPSGNTYVKTIEYNMDDDGNRSSVVTTLYGQSPGSESYTTNSLNQYTVVGGVNQAHDANGNLTSNGTYTFKYNYKNLICEVRTSGGGALVATYKYDANGRRVEKAVNGGITERYIYSGVETVSVYDGSNGWKQDFVFDPTGIDHILALEQADILDEDSDTNTSELTRSYYHTNALGSVMMISTASEDEAASYRYTPYGERTITVGGTPQGSDPLGQGWGYTGRFHDVESELVSCRARALSITTGRFLQRDPEGYAWGNSMFEYATSSPTILTDPSGRRPYTTGAKAKAAINKERAFRAAAGAAARAVDAASAAAVAASSAVDALEAALFPQMEQILADFKKCRDRNLFGAKRFCCNLILLNYADLAAQMADAYEAESKAVAALGAALNASAEANANAQAAKSWSSLPSLSYTVHGKAVVPDEEGRGVAEGADVSVQYNWGDHVLLEKGGEMYVYVRSETNWPAPLYQSTRWEYVLYGEESVDYMYFTSHDKGTRQEFLIVPYKVSGEAQYRSHKPFFGDKGTPYYSTTVRAFGPK